MIDGFAYTGSCESELAECHVVCSGMCDCKRQRNDEDIHGSQKQGVCSAEPCSEEVEQVSVEACA